MASLIGASSVGAPSTVKGGREMNDYDAVGKVEGFVDCKDEDEWITAWQHLIDTGLAWRLQGSIGRHAAALIEQGVCCSANTRR